MLWLTVGHSVSAVPLQSPFCYPHHFLSQVSQPPPLSLFPTNRLLRCVGMPLCILPPHLQAPVPAGFAPVLPSASPREALCKAPVPAGSAPARPSASFREALPKAPAPSGFAIPFRVPFPWRLCAVGPAVHPAAPSWHGHASGALIPMPCAQPFTKPGPASDHAFPSASGLSEDLASSASPSVSVPARRVEGRAQVRATFLLQPSPWVFSQWQWITCPSQAVACFAVGLA